MSEKPSVVPEHAIQIINNVTTLFNITKTLFHPVLVTWNEMRDTTISSFKFGFPRDTTMDKLVPELSVSATQNWVDVFEVKKFLDLSKYGEDIVVKDFWHYTWDCFEHVKTTVANRNHTKWPSLEQLVSH